MGLSRSARPSLCDTGLDDRLHDAPGPVQDVAVPGSKDAMALRPWNRSRFVSYGARSQCCLPSSPIATRASTQTKSQM